jgi:hypothetical protein
MAIAASAGGVEAVPRLELRLEITGGPRRH